MMKAKRNMPNAGTAVSGIVRPFAAQHQHSAPPSTPPVRAHHHSSGCADRNLHQAHHTPSAVARVSPVRRIRPILTIIVLTCGLSSAGAQAPAADSVSQRATALEAELGKYKDSSPEAGRILLQLTDLYYDSGRVFGLVRAAQHFVASHPSDPQHAATMLQLMDGLEALSRKKPKVALNSWLKIEF